MQVSSTLGPRGALLPLKSGAEDAPRRGLTPLNRLLSPGSGGLPTLRDLYGLDTAAAARSLGALRDGGLPGGSVFDSTEALKLRAETVDFQLPGENGFKAAVALREVNYQTVKSLRTAQGGSAVERTSFYGMELELRMEASSPEGLKKAMEAIQDYFSPEKTSERIVRFAVSRFQPDPETAADPEATAQARQDYVDWIRPFVERGFAEARDLLGALAPPVQAKVNDTHQRVGQLFDSFAQDGMGGLEALIRSWHDARLPGPESTPDKTPAAA